MNKSIERLLLGKPGAEKTWYLVVVAIVALILGTINSLVLPGGWWSPPGPTNGLLLAMALVGAVAGYEQYGLLSGVSGVLATSLPPFALLLSGAYYTTTLESPSPAPPTPIERVSTSAVFAVVPGILVGLLGYGLGYGIRVASDRVRSTLATA